MPIRFEWDPAKNDANKRKHGLRFEDAKPIFQRHPPMSDDLEIRELTERDFKHMIRGSTRRRIMEGRIESGRDIVALIQPLRLPDEERLRVFEP